MTATQAFRQSFGDSPNFMTPNIVERGSSRHHHWELSSGEGIFGGEIFGVTVLGLDGSRSELSQSFATEKEARAHIGTIN